MATIFYYVTIDPNVKKTSATHYAYVTSLMRETLGDMRGWKQFNYTFAQLHPLMGEKKRAVSVFGKPSVVHVRVSTDDTIGRECGFTGLSCASTFDNMVYLNADRWINGSAQSGLSLLDYRRYVINHEMGHILGKAHSKCSTEDHDQNEDQDDDQDHDQDYDTKGAKANFCSIMYQQTISTGCCKGNPWVKDVDFVGSNSEDDILQIREKN